MYGEQYYTGAVSLFDGLPIDVDEHPKLCHNITELRNEQDYYKRVISRLTDDSDFEVLSNEDGSETKEYIGTISVWYINKYKSNKIGLVQNYTYKYCRDVLNYSDRQRLMKYLAKYYKLFFGEVIQILLVEDDNELYYWKNNLESPITGKINLNYKKHGTN